MFDNCVLSDYETDLSRHILYSVYRRLRRRMSTYAVAFSGVTCDQVTLLSASGISNDIVKELCPNKKLIPMMFWHHLPATIVTKRRRFLFSIGQVPASTSLSWPWRGALLNKWFFAHVPYRRLLLVVATMSPHSSSHVKSNDAQFGLKIALRHLKTTQVNGLAAPKVPAWKSIIVDCIGG